MGLEIWHNYKRFQACKTTVDVSVDSVPKSSMTKVNKIVEYSKRFIVTKKIIDAFKRRRFCES
jgi:hypothetical protein